MVSHVVNQNTTEPAPPPGGGGNAEVAARAAELKSAMMQMEQKRHGLYTYMTCCRSSVRLHREQSMA